MSDDSLTHSVSVLRRALGDDSAQPVYIATDSAPRLPVHRASSRRTASPTIRRDARGTRHPSTPSRDRSRRPLSDAEYHERRRAAGWPSGLLVSLAAGLALAMRSGAGALPRAWPAGRQPFISCRKRRPDISWPRVQSCHLMAVISRSSHDNATPGGRNSGCDRSIAQQARLLAGNRGRVSSVLGPRQPGASASLRTAD